MSDVFDKIKSKVAVREFADRPLPEDVVREILEAGRLSGSSKNSQPWHFIAVRDRDTLKALSQTGVYARHLAEAALGVVIVQPEPSPSGSPEFDFGRATQNMMLAAWAQGVGSVMASIYEPEQAAQVLGVPQGYHIAWAISFGYPAKPFKKPPTITGRRAFEDVVHWDKW
jgi:nitroreductase